METNNDSIQAPAGVRPTFLTVLCILTFLGSAWGIFGGARDYATADVKSVEATEAMSDAKDRVEEKSGSGFITQLLDSATEGLSAENLRKSAMIGIVASVFTLFGAIMMWGLRRNGFYIYIAGTLIGIAAPFLMFGGSMLGGLTAAGAAIPGIIFIVLYALNLKYMTR